MDPITLSAVKQARRDHLGQVYAQTILQSINTDSVVWAIEMANTDAVLGRVFRHLTQDDTVEWVGLSDMEAVAASETAMDAVAASSTAMDAVIASSTAMDAVAASETAMDAVAASSTAMDAVIASSTACTAIADSATAITALDNSSPVLVPQMTSNTAPSGEASASGEDQPAWQAFDRDSETSWNSGANNDSQWVRYSFVNPVWVYKAYIQTATNTTLQYSSDGTTWITAKTLTANSTTVVSVSSGKVRHWRTIGGMGTGWRAAAQLQFYCK